jgi:hypothetical protein
MEQETLEQLRAELEEAGMDVDLFLAEAWLVLVRLRLKELLGE